MRRSLLSSTRPALLVALGLGLISGPAQAVGIQGRIRNVGPVTQSLGTSQVMVLLTNLAEGRIVGMGSLRGAQFDIAIPDGFRPPVRPAAFCPGVKSVPAEPRVYTAESLMVYQPGRNRAALLTQADHPTDPTRRSQWMYSDRPAAVKGRCTGLNTSYDLTLRAGWNAVMTVSEPGRFTVKNATPGLPYWAAGNVFSGARATFSALFDGR